MRTTQYRIEAKGLVVEKLATLGAALECARINACESGVTFSVVKSSSTRSRMVAVVFADGSSRYLG